MHKHKAIRYAIGLDNLPRWRPEAVPMDWIDYPEPGPRLSEVWPYWLAACIVGAFFWVGVWTVATWIF